MFCLARLHVLPKYFLELKYDVPLCTACMFGKYQHCTWITKGNKLGSICNETNDKPGSGVSVDQLQSTQTGLVPQFWGGITSPKIWDAQSILDH